MRARVLSISELRHIQGRAQCHPAQPQLDRRADGRPRRCCQGRGVPRQADAERLRLVGWSRPALFGDAGHARSMSSSNARRHCPGHPGNAASARPRRMTSRLGRLLGLDRRNRVRTPTILQMELTECGPAALAIILAYFGRRVARGAARRLRRRATACKASSIMRAARRYGLDAKGHRLELDEVLAGPFPVIVHGASTISSCSRASRIPASSSTTRRPVRAFPANSTDFTGVGLLCARSGLQAGGASAGCWPSSACLSGCHVGIGIIAWLSLMLVFGAGPAGRDQGLRRRHPGQALRGLAEPAAGRARRHVRAADRVVGVQQMALVRLEQAGAGRVGALHVACASPAGGVLQPAFRRRPRQPHRLERPGGPAAGARLRASGDLLHRRVPRHRDAVLRSDAGGHRHRRRRPQCRAADADATRAAGHRAAPADRRWASCTPSRSWACNPSRR